VDTGMSLRGGQRQLLLLASGLRARGHHQIIVCCEGSALEARAGLEGLPVTTLPAHDPAHALGIQLLRQQINLSAIQILHAHDGRGQTISWLASMGLAVRRIASRRVTFTPRDRWTYRLKYTRTCDAVIAVSEYIRDLVTQAGVPRGRVEVIPDGIELPVNLPGAVEKSRVRNSWGFGDDDFVVGQLGAFTPEKGQDTALDAFGVITNTLPQARLVLAGDGAVTPANRMKSLGTRVLFLNHLESLADFFPGLDLFIMPSKAEGLGSSALWAMAYCLPVVGSRVGGLPEVVAEGETGWLIPPSSPEALANAIVLAASDRERLVQFGRNGRKRAEAYSADIMIGRSEALYCRLVQDGAQK
jgi:glycosyltransferase involved in cell wall biosynthesis